MGMQGDTPGGGGGVTDHGALTGLGDDDHVQYLNNARHDLPARHGATVVDHGSIGGLGDDDHAQYHNDARGDIRYYTQATFINISAGVGSAGLPIVLDAAGHIDATMINDGDIDHGSVGGLGDDDHTQYALLAGRAGGQSLIGGIAANENLTLQSTSHGTRGYIVGADPIELPGQAGSPVAVADNAFIFGFDAAAGDCRVFILGESGGLIGLGNSEVRIYDPSVATRYSQIKQSAAEGIANSSDLRIGLDESLRTLIICDSGDIGNDFGLSASAYPCIKIYRSQGDRPMHISYSKIETSVENLLLSANGGNSQVILEGSIINNSLGSGNIYHTTYQQDVADDGSFNLLAVTDSAYGVCIAGNNEEYAVFIIDNDGDVTLVNNSANVVANADTDAKLCIGTAATQEPLTIKNRLGGTRNINLLIWYS